MEVHRERRRVEMPSFGVMTFFSRAKKRVNSKSLGFSQTVVRCGHLPRHSHDIKVALMLCSLVRERGLKASIIQTGFSEKIAQNVTAFGLSGRWKRRKMGV